jgi:gamma-glutamyl-gamma-aminobutyraldehyde dehydrogenase
MTKKSRADWEAMIPNLSISQQAIIGGKAVDAASGQTFDCISPIDGKKLATVASCGSEDVERAVSSARKAFESGVWSERPPAARKKIMQLFARKVAEHADELALLETLDMGKPIADSLHVDVSATVNCFDWNAEAIDKVYDEIAPTGPGELGLITREPLGVIGAIVPWNFPMLMAAWKLGPALVTGNSVILKPSEKSPLTAIRLAELALEAGIPEGVFNVLPGFGKEAGEPLAAHMDVDGLVFTGSTAIGKHLMSVAALSNMKRTFVECGGKSPNVVFADIPDIEKAAGEAAGAIFFNQGEVCTAASRLLVQKEIKDDFINEVVKAAGTMQPTHPLEPCGVGATMGAMVDGIQTERVMGYVKSGQDEGAELRCGGSRASVEENGFYIEPTVFDKVTNKMTIASEEIFGPVLSCISFDDEDEAISIANDTPYGLAACVWTNDLSRAHRVARKIRAGSVWVNYCDGGDMTAPFGGFKQSGNGRDKSLHALDKYTELKATWINLGS